MPQLTIAPLSHAVARSVTSRVYQLLATHGGTVASWVPAGLWAQVVVSVHGASMRSSHIADGL